MTTLLSHDDTNATPSRWMLTRWLVGHVGSLMWPLGISVVARIVGQLLTVSLFIMGVSAIVHTATGVPVHVNMVVAAMAGIAFLKAFVRYLEHYTGHWVAFSALHRLRVAFFAKLVPQAPAATAGRSGADVAERATSDIDRIEVFFAHTFPPAISAVVVPTAAIVWLGVTTSWTLALALIPATIILVLVLPMVGVKSSWAAARSVASTRGEIATHLTDDVQGIREVLAFELQQQRLSGVDRLSDRLTSARMGVAWAQGVRNGAQMLLQTVNVIVVCVVGSATDASAAHIAIAVTVAIALWGPISGIDDFATGLDAAYAATARIHQIITTPPAVTDPQHPVSFPPITDVELSHVDFGYEKNRKTLNDVNLRIPHASWSYLVGVSGSGKSTVAAMILRGWDPQSGTVTIGGVDVSTMSLHTLRSQVAIASQRDTMIAGSIRDNVTLRRPDATDDDVAAALRVADVDGWVNSLPQGWDSPIAERGTSLSGGQLQRLSIARALIGKPHILIIDEALSQLDEATARTVRKRIAALRITVLEITHRVDIIGDNEDVAIIDGGRVVEHARAGALRAHSESMLNKIDRRTS